MSERLTDDELTGHLDYVDSQRASGKYGATFGKAYRAALELRERRALDLTDEERATLKYLNGCAMAETRRTRIADRDRAFKLIDKLLSGAK